jgi:hypothetical protein
MAYSSLSSGHNLCGQGLELDGGRILVKRAAEAPVGAVECRSEQTTIWRCGEIIKKNQKSIGGR